MESKIETLTKEYKEIAFVSTVSSGTILTPIDKETLPSLQIHFSQIDYINNEKRKFVKVFRANNNRYHSDVHPIEIRGDVVYQSLSPSQEKLIIFRHKKEKDDTKTVIIEIWSKGQMIDTIDCKETHDILYTDDTFQHISWSKDENEILYIAEKKKKKKMQFWDKKNKEKQEYGMYEYREEWGEDYEGCSDARLYRLNIEKREVVEIEGIPEYMSVGQPSFTPDEQGAIFIAYDTRERRLGIRSCKQRPNALYELSFSDRTLKRISDEEEWTVLNPRFSPSKKEIVYLSMGKVPFHLSCERLLVIDYQTKKTRVAVDIVKEAKWDDFPGIYAYALHPHCWMEDGIHVLINTIWHSQRSIIKVNTQNGKVMKIDNPQGTHESLTMLDYSKEYILALQQAPNKHYHIWLGKWEGDQLKWIHVENVWDVIPSTLKEKLMKIKWYVMTIPTKDGNQIEAVVLQPPLPKPDSKVPIILEPHGGPHSAYTTAYVLDPLYQALQGYGIIRVNYRGSLGFSQSFVEALYGRCGDLDVEDSKRSVEYLLEKEKWVDENGLTISGGSHGGYITGMMIGKYPELFKAAVMHNPVCNIASMHGTTDIPDWTLTACGTDPYTKEFIDEEEIVLAFKTSPMSLVKNVRTPTLLLLGTTDLRVPFEQGRQFYYALKKNKVPTKILSYKSNHSILEPACQADRNINLILWMETYLKK